MKIKPVFLSVAFVVCAVIAAHTTVYDSFCRGSSAPLVMEGLKHSAKMQLRYNGEPVTLNKYVTHKDPEKIISYFGAEAAGPVKAMAFVLYSALAEETGLEDFSCGVKQEEKETAVIMAGRAENKTTVIEARFGNEMPSVPRGYDDKLNHFNGAILESGMEILENGKVRNFANLYSVDSASPAAVFDYYADALEMNGWEIFRNKENPGFMLIKKGNKEYLLAAGSEKGRTWIYVQG